MGARAPARRWFKRGLRDSVGEVSPTTGRKGMDVVDGEAAFCHLPLSPLGPHPPIPGTGSHQLPRGVGGPAFAHASPPSPPPIRAGLASHPLQRRRPWRGSCLNAARSLPILSFVRRLI